MKEHKIDCATNAVGQIDEAIEAGCTCGADKQNLTEQQARSNGNVSYTDCLPELETMIKEFFKTFGTIIPHIELFEEPLRKELRWFNEIGYKNGVIHAYKNVLSKNEASNTV